MATKTKAAEPKAKTEPVKSKVVLIFGNDDFLVSARARQVVDSLVDKSAGEFGLETVEGRADNTSQAVAALKRVDEALNTFAFFGGGKTVWLKNANFLGTSRTGEAKDVVEQLEKLSALLKRGLAQGFALVISATEIDKRRAFYKTIEKVGELIALGTANEWGKIDTEQLEAFASSQARQLGKTIEDDALQSVIALTGGNYRALASEIEKIATYVGDKKEVTLADVAAIGSSSAESIVWDLGDAIADRSMGRALKILDRLLFQGENEIGLLFALITKMRTLLLVRELIDRKLLPMSNNFGSFKISLQRAADQAKDSLPADRRFNPLMQHPFAVFKSAQQAQRFSLDELRRAMELLLEANKRLISSSIDGKIVLEQTLITMIQAQAK
jgi:DNA polymerase-3 subunit delta